MVWDRIREYSRRFHFWFVMAPIRFDAWRFDQRRQLELLPEQKVRLQKLAEAGSAEACLKLSELYLTGDEDTVDPGQAALWFEKLLKMDEERFSPDIMCRIGHSFEFGQATDVDLEKARSWYNRALKEGEVRALFHLGGLCFFGKGVKQDIPKALDYYQQAAKKDIPQALTKLGWLALFGKEGVEKDPKKAINFFERAIKLRDAEAMYHMGHIYKYGEGVKRDHHKSTMWYKLSSQFGFDRAQFKVGFMYSTGQDVMRDLSEGMKHIQEAAKQGNSWALYRLGMIYEKGKEGLVDKNPGLAADYFLRAAKKGDALALLKMGSCYEKGFGVGQDLQKALEYYQEAAGKGQEKAERRMLRLKEKMNSGGFTLLELMIVVMIIAILMAVAIPSYTRYLAQAQMGEVLSFAGSLREEVAEYYHHTGTFPKDNHALAIPSYQGAYVQRVDVIDGAIHLHMKEDRVQQELSGKVFSLRPGVYKDNPTGPLLWRCGQRRVAGVVFQGKDQTTIEGGLLPDACS
ncbi:pilin [Magnetococcales bacterium HHB-1]